MPARPGLPSCCRAFARGHQPNPVETRLQARPVRRPPIALYSSHAPISPAAFDPNPATGKRPAHRTMFRRGAKCQCQVPVPGASAKCGHHVPDRTTHIPPCAADCLSQSGHEFIREVRKASERQSFSVLIESEPVSGFAREYIARADTKHVRAQAVRRPHRRLASSHTRRRHSCTCSD